MNDIISVIVGCFLKKDCFQQLVIEQKTVTDRPIVISLVSKYINKVVKLWLAQEWNVLFWNEIPLVKLIGNSKRNLFQNGKMKIRLAIYYDVEVEFDITFEKRDAAIIAKVIETETECMSDGFQTAVFESSEIKYYELSWPLQNKNFHNEYALENIIFPIGKFEDIYHYKLII